MSLSTVDYQEANLKAIPFITVFKEYREKVTHGIDLEHEMNRAYEAHDTEAMFSIASELGVISVKLQIIEAEMERRDEEDGPLTGDEAKVAQDAVFEELLKSLLGDSNE